MQRALLAWEGGAGRGHLVTLRTIAEAVSDRYLFDAVLCRMQHAGELSSICEDIAAGPSFQYTAANRARRGDVLTSTWGENLGDVGFRDPDFLERRFRYWRELIERMRPALVIGDYAPLALWTAMSLGIPAVAAGVGLALPPPQLDDFPFFMPEERTTRIHDEAEMLAAFNEAAGRCGLDRAATLPAVYATDDQFVLTLPFLDPYLEHRSAPLLPPMADVAEGFAGQGREVFVYFSTTELNHPALVEAVGLLAGTGTTVRAFMPGISEPRRVALAAAGVVFEDAPVPVDLLAARTGLILHSAQHGILCLALAAGIPQLAFPQHTEQIFHAGRARDQGVLTAFARVDYDAAAIVDAARAALADTMLASRALELARELRPLLAVNRRKWIRRRLADFA